MAGVEDPPLRPPDAAAPAPADGRDTTADRGADDDEGQEEHDQDGEQQLSCLPEDVLADILGRLRHRWLAASRCVCKSWRDAVDVRGLLRADLLPLSLAGIFVHFDEHKFPEFFSRPSSPTGACAASGDLSFMCSINTPDSGFGWNYSYDDEWKGYTIEDHCNGLLLLRNACVVNPATRRWNTLPPPPLKQTRGISYRKHLVFDPTASPHHEVFMVPYLDGNGPEDDVDPLVEASEWPPSPCKMYVFSSGSGYWEEKSFVREGDASGTVAAGRERWFEIETTAVYWRGALYVHCQTDFVMRISLFDNKYSVIKPPMDIRLRDYVSPYLARSEKGVYFASLDKWLLRVWILKESCGQMEWILKHVKDLKPLLVRCFDRRVHGPWILEDINYNLFLSSRFPKDNLEDIVEEFEWNSDNDDVVENVERVKDCYLDDYKKSIVKEKFGWNSNNYNALDNGDMVEACYSEDNKKVIVEEKFEWNSNNYNALDHGGMVERYYLDEEQYSLFNEIIILGFHPYKEIVFLRKSVYTGLAYHLNSSMVEVLGNIYPAKYTFFKELGNELEEIKAHPYTPCWMEEFPGRN